MPDPQLQALYNATSETYNLGSFDEFKAKMADSSKRRLFYDAVSQEFDLGDFETFESKVLPAGAGNIVPEQAEGVGLSDALGASLARGIGGEGDQSITSKIRALLTLPPSLAPLALNNNNLVNDAGALVGNTLGLPANLVGSGVAAARDEDRSFNQVLSEDDIPQVFTSEDFDGGRNPALASVLAPFAPGLAISMLQDKTPKERALEANLIVNFVADPLNIPGAKAMNMLKRAGKVAEFKDLVKEGNVDGAREVLKALPPGASFEAGEQGVKAKKASDVVKQEGLLTPEQIQEAKRTLNEPTSAKKNLGDKTEKDTGPSTLQEWVRRRDIRIKTSSLKEFGIGEGSQENRTLFMRVGQKDGQSLDEVARQALSEGVIDPPPPGRNLDDWFSEKLKENSKVASSAEVDAVRGADELERGEAPVDQIVVTEGDRFSHEELTGLDDAELDRLAKLEEEALASGFLDEAPSTRVSKRPKQADTPPITQEGAIKAPDSPEPSDVAKLADETAKIEPVSDSAKTVDIGGSKSQTANKNVPGERSFPKTLERGGLEGGTDRVYEVATDAAAVEKASSRITKDPDGAIRFAVDENTPGSKEKVTTGILSLQKLSDEIAQASDETQKLALAEKQIEIANSLSRQLTAAGQEVQAASLVNRLSPEGLVMFAQKKADQVAKAEKRLPEKLSTDTVQQLNKMGQSAKGIESVVRGVDAAKDVAKKIKKGDPLSADDIKSLDDLRTNIEREFNLKPTKIKPKKGLENQKTTSRKQTLDNYLSKKEAEARERLKKRGFNFNAGLNPQDVADLTIVGAAQMNRVGKRFIQWSKAMKDRFGDAIEPHLKRIFKRSASLLSSEAKKAREANKLSNQLKKMHRDLEANVEITQVDLDNFNQLLNKMDNYAGDVREEVLFEIQKFINDFEKPTVGRKLATAQTIGQLLNPKTITRNIVGNELFYRVERLNHYAAAPIDWVASKFTGQRSITFKKGGQGGYWEGFLRGVKHGWQGLNPEGLTTQFDLTGIAFKSKHNPFHWLERALGASLRSFDIAAYNRAYKQFMGEQAELAIINKKIKFKDDAERAKFVEDYINNADFNITELAKESGKYMTFQDENRLSDFFTRMKRGLNLGFDFGLGDFVLKYPKTPANLLMRALEYSPAGFARSIRILQKPYLDPVFKQRDFVESLSRAIVGTFGFTGLGAYLFDKGVLTGTQIKDKDARNFVQQQTGERNYQVNASAIKRFLFNGLDPKQLNKRQGDLLVSYDWAQPVAIAIAFGANRAKELSEKKDITLGVADEAYTFLNSAMNTLVEQPLLKGLQDVFGGRHTDDQMGRAARILQGVPASFVPTFLSQIRQYTDNDRRMSYDPSPLQSAINKAIFKLPGVNKQLPLVFKSIGGDPAQSYQDGTNTLFNVFFNPAFIAKYNIDPEIQKIIDPFTNEKRKKQFPKVAPYTIRRSKSTLEKYDIEIEDAIHNFELTAEDISRMQKRMSNTIVMAFKKDLPDLDGLTFEEQEKEMALLVDESYREAVDWFLTHEAKKYLEDN